VNKDVLVPPEIKLAAGMSRVRKSIFWIVTAALPILALLLGIQFASYWSLPGWPLPFDNRLVSFDPEIGYVARPHARANWGKFASGPKPFAFHVYTDRLGARVTRPGEETPSRPDIVFIGCSFTWGDGVEGQDTFAIRVAQGLAATAANLALFAHGTTQAVQILRRNRSLQPKLVVYSFITDHLFRNVFIAPNPTIRSVWTFRMW
jgi:hypothetical protein